MPPENSSDPLFWPLLFVALIVGAFVLGFVKVVAVLARREPGHHPQHAQDHGTNTNDASSHTTINVDQILVNSPRLSSPDD